MTPVHILLFIVAVLVGVSLILAVLHYRERHALECIRSEPTGAAFSTLSVALAFDPDHAILWETQVPALELISAAGPQGIHVRQLYAWYRTAAAHYPELYEGSGFKPWLEFLREARLVTFDECRVAVTREGHEFLHYRVTAEPVRQ